MIKVTTGIKRESFYEQKYDLLIKIMLFQVIGCNHVCLKLTEQAQNPHIFNKACKLDWFINHEFNHVLKKDLSVIFTILKLNKNVLKLDKEDCCRCLWRNTMCSKWEVKKSKPKKHINQPILKVWLVYYVNLY